MLARKIGAGIFAYMGVTIGIMCYNKGGEMSIILFLYKGEIFYEDLGL